MGSRRMGSASPTARLPARRRSIWRFGTLVPAVLSGVLAVAVAGALRSVPQISSAASVTPGTPVGDLVRLDANAGGLRPVGWAFDPDDRKAAARVNVRVDGEYSAGMFANMPRDDVAQLHPVAGPNHGFNFFAPVPEGKHTVCVRVKNAGPGDNLVLKCVTRTFDYGPRGSLDTLTTQPGHLVVRGWVIDWDQPTAPVTVDVVIDGVVTKLLANQYRKDVAAIAPHAGGNHGYAATLPLRQGTHRVCLVGVNIGYGSNNSLSCQTITLNDNPKGALESATQVNGALKITGWAFDNDTPASPVIVSIGVDGVSHLVRANLSRPDIAATYPGIGNLHGFSATYKLPEGKHTVCVTAHNVGYGADAKLGCLSPVLNFTPSAALSSLTATSTGVHIRGWASDPDTANPISVAVRIDGRLVSTQPANGNGLGHDGHVFDATLLARSGTHRVCVIGLNTLYGTHDSVPSCLSITLALKPLGAFQGLTRVAGSSDLRVSGWALDPDTTNPITVRMTLDGAAAGTATANATRTDIGKRYPSFGDNHGLWARVPASDGEHTLCATAANVGGGADVQLGCKLIFAVHPVAPSAPRNVQALAGFGGAEVTWQKPLSDGGAPWTQYVVVSTPGNIKVPVAADATSATVLGLQPATSYTFAVRAVNVAGTSLPATSPAVTTEASPPPQTTPAPVSTSRYIRNIHGSSSSDLTMMRREGATDAYYNPSGHGYLILLDIGGQDQYDGGVVLSAGVRFVTYGDLVACLKAYVDGYHSKQKASAPVTIAIGTNNDMDVSWGSGRTWARQVVQPVVDYAKKYPGITIAGANDIEPGFRATYAETKDWLGGYLANTAAPFVFNGSADGCSWSQINLGCNNGWRMSGLYYLAAGAAPVRMLNLPQIYNTTMAGQWKYISLTGIAAGSPRINFGGTLTEWTACAQTHSCGSLTGHTAWQTMWNDLQSDARLKVASLPYSTDLRIDS
jgi:Fibronectin type III domain